ncbi:hypothetical protein D9619_003937 [Psilocybe cf. subviscida]|uniref:NodB homology domain-containing protein n=1 Tax=Psilocybe cf. subviscida TaxID=2480587 RepID=A0A8H5BQL8_9AGAR|nr:hypothetical protein D9619_003937 [Psilocybe cf. subviscida]
MQAISIPLIALSVYLSTMHISAVFASPQYEPRAAAEVITSCTVDNVVALTFDDGPSDYMEDVVNKLKAVGGKGTFFINGNNGRSINNEPLPTYIKYAYDNGFQLGSHTWEHKDLATLGREEINNQMSLTEEAIHKIIGVTPAFTRPPYGSYNDLVLEVASQRRQSLVNWDFDSQDSENSPVETQKAAYDQLIAKHPKSILSLEHDTIQSSSAEVLPYAIEKLQAAGYKFVTVAECLSKAPYLDGSGGSNGDQGGSGGAGGWPQGGEGERGHETWKQHRRAIRKMIH